jgi:hypothetical protein
MKNLRYLLAFFLVAWAFSLASYGQDCAEKLETAEQKFSEGHIEEVTTEMLRDCIGEGTDAQKARAMRLLTIKYLLLPNQEKADSLFKELLKFQPEFRIDTSQKTDPAELIYLYRAFRTRPVLSIRYHTGTTFSLVNPGLAFNIDNSLSADALETYGPEPGFIIGAEGTLWIFNRNLGISSGINFVNQRFEYEEELDTYGTPSQVSGTQFSTEFTESTSMISVPVTVRFDFDYTSPYNFERRDLTPFVTVGLVNSFVLQSKFLRPERVNLVSGQITAPQDISVTALRQAYLLSATASAGLKLKYGQSYFTFEFRYNQGLTNAVAVQNRFSNLDVIRDLGYVDDNFRVNSAWIMLGVEQNIYFPQRKRSQK